MPVSGLDDDLQDVSRRAEFANEISTNMYPCNRLVYWNFGIPELVGTVVVTIREWRRTNSVPAGTKLRSAVYLSTGLSVHFDCAAVWRGSLAKMTKMFIRKILQTPSNIKLRYKLTLIENLKWLLVLYVTYQFNYKFVICFIMAI